MINITKEEFFKAVESPFDRPPRLFIPVKGPDKRAAALRYAAVDKVMEDWYSAINSGEANARELPDELLTLYEKACDLMLEIRERERDILIGR